ncbi:mechanosensitive ion channel family protein [Acinetobacter shaoyimingii]|uniref:Mechanosensitive ion channel n=1 Tax=Acinetobacter shaoyimingii TaxID=2715164 RepID=A0A6G8RZ40_9GAMM|nr:mechanosensitive ion channel domain-containing protein [Acinetobacter shaoyimingii]NHB59327.1 mechanosensitive ion channel [Acinetobacter shaoyimingii]QIO07222.1 mechanosensitive ion channel [Acinetobacter shaoyimingii]
MLKDLIQRFSDWIDQYPWLEMLTSLSIVILLAFLLYVLTRKVVVVGLRRLINKLPFAHKNIFENHSVIRRIANIVPALFIINAIASVPHLSEKFVQMVQMLAQAWIFITIALSISEFLNIFNLIYQRNPKSQNKPIKGYLQLVKLIVYIVCALMILGTFLKKDVFTLLAGFGAMAAVLMLVFQNTILSLVASVQISSYDMIRIGDWIEMPSLGADGTVIDMSLHTVKVQNFDKTYTTIPTNRLVTDTFKNWRGMADANCRRIKRSIYIDQSSIHFLNDSEFEKLQNFLILQQYLKQKTEELSKWNRTVTDLRNQRRLTNLGTFRAYLVHYLRQHPSISQEETLLVRQLQPTPQGVPLEIYVFSKTTVWADYEDIQSDIFDHILAIIGEFGLHAYQAPSGLDLNTWLDQKNEV